MELNAARKRIRAASCGDILAVDRLSDLPDCIIHHIMSFMKARQVVQTCVLSTRWTDLWRSVPSLDVDDEEFKAADANGDTSSEEWEKFQDFADHLLTNNISLAHLDTFRLHATSRYSYSRRETAARWIRHAVKYSALAPGIQREGFSCRSWRLRRLHLSNVSLNDLFAKHVTLGCQYLEDLELKDCSCNFLEIISHSLKSLVLKNCSARQLSVITSSTLESLVIDGGNNAHPLVITAPAVTCLLLLGMSDSPGSVCSGISISEMTSLVKASIVIEVDYWTSTGTQVRNYREFLNGLTNVSTLELSGFKAMVAPDVEQVELPIFENLRSLLLDECDLSNKFQLLRHFLHKSPSLEKLTVRCCTHRKGSARRKGKVDLKKTSSQFQNLVDFQYPQLKSTEIIYKDGDNIVGRLSALLDISYYVLKNTITLTKI